MKALALLIVMGLFGCQTPREPLVVPAILQSCPPGHPGAKTPPTPRTAKQLLDWALDTHKALLMTEDARTECASRLNKLNELIREQNPP